MRIISLPLVAALLLAGCPRDARQDAPPGAAAPPVGAPADIGATARAELVTGEAQEIGSATLQQTNTGVLIRLELDGARPGTRAFHIHETGRCEPPTFQSAGGHYNPDGRQHGMNNPHGKHAGDLPNLHIPEDGQLTIEVLAPTVTLAELLAGDGTALVIHEGVDDYQSDPTGEAGGRYACGVITR
jgi:superoxide dismutase, Cu-Zn family